MPLTQLESIYERLVKLEYDYTTLLSRLNVLELMLNKMEKVLEERD